jgi:hypothetical protein
MAILDKTAIMEARDLELVEVDVPEWGGSVYLRPLTAKDRDYFEAEILALEQKKKSKKDGPVYDIFKARLVARALVDENGKRLFTDKEFGELSSKSAAALNRLFEECLRINQVTQQDVEELTKNSDSGHTGDS